MNKKSDITHSVSSLKYSNFVNEPMGFKHISHVPGIDQQYSDLLEELGFDEVNSNQIFL